MILLFAALAAAPLPADIRAFQQRHARCQVLSEAERPDPRTADRVDSAWHRQCLGVDAAKERLVSRYRKSRRLSALLDNYEDLGS